MANELILPAPAGLTFYEFILNATGQVARLDTQTFEALTEANRANYAVPLLPSGITTLYLGSMPDWIPAGTYGIQPWRQLGGAPASTDLLWPNGELEWGGAGDVPLNPVPTAAEIAEEVKTVLRASQGSGLWDGSGFPDSSGHCRIIGLEYDGNDEPVDGRAVSYEYTALPQWTPTALLEGTRYTTSTNGDGQWAIRRAVIGATIRILIPQSGVDTVLQVPDQAELNLRDYLASL